MAAKLCAFTRFNKPPVLDCSKGNPERLTYRETLDSFGVKQVVVDGSEDFQSYIDSFADDCDIYRILDRLSLAEKSPDVVLEALSQFRPDLFSPGKYGDFSNMPKNIHEVSKFYQDSVAFFNGLPVDIRKKYHYSVDEFFADFDNFVKTFNVSEPSSESSSEPASEPVKEVSTDE